MILTKLLDRRLLCCEVLRSKNLLSPPFITGSSAEHTSHQMIASICVTEGMKGIVLIYTKILAGNKYRSGSTKGNIALSVTNSSSTNSCCRIVSSTSDNLNILREAKLFSNLWLQRSNNLPALINLRKLLLFHTADFHHFFRPAAILYIQKKHT